MINAILATLVVVLSAAPTEVRLRSSKDGPVENVSLSSFEQVERISFDVQYNRRAKFRGVPLETLLARLKGTGLVRAHFTNGMIVILPDSAGLQRLDILVATSMWESKPAGHEAWVDLPPAHKVGARERDVRPTTFSGNKFVVKERWYQGLSDKALAVFTPWMHVDTLVELERVTEAELANEFAAGTTPLEKRGRELFDQRCRFCHGVGQVGASLGWDFLKPIPLSEYRTKEGLFLHVKHRSADAPEKGYLMPALSDLTAKDAEALWEWMSLLSRDTSASSGKEKR